jgi:serine/threonine-protein kinase
VFAAGVTLYEALAGAPPFDGENLAAVLYQIIHEVPAPVSERNPAVPRPLEPVIERAMAKDPEARYPTAREFGDALNQAMTARTPIGRALAEAATQVITVPIGTGAKAATRRTDAASRSSRRRAPVALVAAACLAAAALGGWMAWARWPSERPTVASRAPSQTAPQTTAAAVTPLAGAKPIAASPSPSPAEPQANPAAGMPSAVSQASAEPSRPREAAPAPAVTPRPATRSSVGSSSPSEVPAEPAAVTRSTDPDRSASPAIASAPSGGVSPATPPPVEKPAPPTAPSGTIEAPPEPVTAPPPAPVDDARARQAPALGAIWVSTNPAVDVFLDGEFRGRTQSQPLVVSKVSPGQRVLTLRLGAREQIVLATVNGGQTTAVSHQFPGEPARPTSEKVRDAIEQGQREAVDKLREGVDKAQREVVGGIRGLLEKIDPDREKRGRDQERKPDRR